MDFNKYKNLLFQKIKKQITMWFETNKELISNTEVYSFLHSIRGTSGTLGLGGLYQLSGTLMDSALKSSEKQWDQDELRAFLDDLINLAYEYENFNEVKRNKGRPLSDNIPLIQIIDDDVSMLILLKDTLEEKGWMVIANTEPAKALTQYIDLKPDCVIIDVNLPNKSGFELLTDLQMHSNHHFVPKVMISIVNNREVRINAFKKGADDFIEKPIDLEELIVRIERLLTRKKQFDQSVLLDELTKLYNRKFLKDVYDRNINDLQRYNKVFSLAIVDLDHFKQINDTFGHLMGDEILSQFATFIKQNTRSSDIVFRYGGEEFVIIFPNTSQTETVEIVSRLLKDFSQLAFGNQNQLSVSFSAGVFTIHHPETSMEDAMKTADQALYLAKAGGRARVEAISQPSVQFEKKPLFVSIIDDDAIIRSMLIRILGTMQFEDYELNLQSFEDGVQFFQSKRLEEKGEHFLILDGVMPVMDGMEILQKVNKDRNIHVLMLTGRKNEADIERALRLGADDYVTKPFSIKELQARIQRLIVRMK